MAVFSTNQNRQLYVVKEVVNETPSKIGQVQLLQIEGDKQVFFKYFGPDGLIRSDLISTPRITYMKKTAKEKLQRKLKKATISLDSKVNGGDPIAGQDYMVKISIRDYILAGDTNIGIKYGVAHAYKGMTKEDLYKALAKSLERNFSREVIPLFKFEFSASGVVITELEQPWVLGTKSQTSVSFEILPTTVTFEGDEVFWMTRDDKDRIPLEDTATIIGNGRSIADLEYFCMGERGDQYRNIGYPNIIPTKYLVDSEKAYDVLDIHYSFVDSGVDNHKSEKDLILVAESMNLLTQIEETIKNYSK